jgi:steroid 5-alpha reductase family enzyme
MTPTDLLLLNLAVIGTCVAGLWIVSLPLRNVSFVDAFWPIGFGLVAWTTYLAAAPEHPRALMLLAFASLWALRLGVYLLSRWIGEPEEDKRYQAMREKRSAFSVQSLYLVFGLQGVMIVLVGLPLIFGISNAEAPLGWLDAAGLVLFVSGFLMEAVADTQLAAFRREPANAGKVMDRGLWAWSRHPNYFGNTVLWWGLYLIALSDAGNWWTVIGPILMTWLILKVSGVSLLERGLEKSRPGYSAYAARTSAFWPRPPGSST